VATTCPYTIAAQATRVRRFSWRTITAKLSVRLKLISRSMVHLAEVTRASVIRSSRVAMASLSAQHLGETVSHAMQRP
jgi:hypothetical protein